VPAIAIVICNIPLVPFNTGTATLHILLSTSIPNQAWLTTGQTADPKQANQNHNTCTRTF
jgi:hypothetical protein